MSFPTREYFELLGRMIDAYAMLPDATSEIGAIQRMAQVAEMYMAEKANKHSALSALGFGLNASGNDLAPCGKAWRDEPISTTEPVTTTQGQEESVSDTDADDDDEIDDPLSHVDTPPIEPADDKQVIIAERAVKAMKCKETESDQNGGGYDRKKKCEKRGTVCN